jgi:hypothetical protein
MFIHIAKYQAERMYSEEEVLELLHKRMIYNPTDEKEKLMTYWGGLEKPKQETLEEAAVRLYPIILEDDGWDKNTQYRDEWIEGAKWQQNDRFPFLNQIIDFEDDYHRILFECYSLMPKEAAEKYAEPYRCPATNENEYCKHDIISAFKAGAKWQQERSYSEEEVLELLHKRMIYTLGEEYKKETTLKWFEKIKKK